MLSLKSSFTWTASRCGRKIDDRAIQHASLDQPPLSGRITTEGQWDTLPSNGVTSELPMITDESWRAPMFNLPDGEGSSFNIPMMTDESWKALRLDASLESRRIST